MGRRYKQDKDEERLLRALIEMATEVDEHDKLSVPLSASRAATQAKLRDPEPVLERLVGKDHICHDPDYPNHYRLCPVGRNRAQSKLPG